ncbi:predicted protein [Plenodomus lingam JN3]|uniref:Predicted protein n=1 Tax=Leptosphaeria maculans (strain JN3 / isolate v23.1.3 / race Av1-4-5-6-7-8) TaxID=985895 RepID=E5A227_LEPMJ|nr:predicted protein [Plenodomus lingam JN3]CBX97744.1 predicted protein [Plenodomus lingam JN3]
MIKAQCITLAGYRVSWILGRDLSLYLAAFGARALPDLEIGGISIIVGCGIAEHCPFPLEAAGSKANIWGKGWIPIGSQRLSKASESL